MDSDQQNPLVLSRNLQIIYPLVPTCWLLLNLSCEFCHLQEEMTVLLPHWVVSVYIQAEKRQTDLLLPSDLLWALLLSPASHCTGEAKAAEEAPMPDLAEQGEGLLGVG